MTSALSKLTFFKPKPRPIYIISGLPRSGTSMMMKILEAGGMEILTDHLRTADEDNPKGYFEFERVKQLQSGDTAWVTQAQGRVVKVISFLLQYLPAQYSYKVIFMRRDVNEILASQREMLIRRGEETNESDTRVADTFQEHLKRVRVWLANQPNIQVLYVDYNALMKAPERSIRSVYDYLALELDLEKMLSVPDANLYRQRQG
jgi:hypothetical protein